MQLLRDNLTLWTSDMQVNDRNETVLCFIETADNGYDRIVLELSTNIVHC